MPANANVWNDSATLGLSPGGRPRSGEYCDKNTVSMGVLVGVTVRLSLWWMTDLEEGLGLRLVVPLALHDGLVLLVCAAGVRKTPIWLCKYGHAVRSLCHSLSLMGFGT